MDFVLFQRPLNNGRHCLPFASGCPLGAIREKKYRGFIHLPPRNRNTVSCCPRIAAVSSRSIFYLAFLRVNRQPRGRLAAISRQTIASKSTEPSQLDFPGGNLNWRVSLSAGTARNSPGTCILGLFTARLPRVFHSSSRFSSSVIFIILFSPPDSFLPCYFCIFRPAYFIFPFSLPLPPFRPRLSRLAIL